MLSRYLRPIVIFLIIICIYILCSWLGLFNVPRLKAGDLFINLRYKIKPPPGHLEDIVILGIDDSAYYSYGKKWPWRRDMFTSLLYILAKYDPAIIGFNLAFVGESTASFASDSLLAEAFRDAGNVLLVSYFDKDGRYITPFKDFSESALGYGFTNKPEDIDKVIRETRLFQCHTLEEEIIDYAFELKLVALFKGGSLNKIKFTGKEIQADVLEGALKIPVAKNGIMPLNYSARMSDFTQVPFEAAVKESGSLEIIRDKIVLVGTTGEVFHDSNFTPLEMMPGIGVIANTILMFLNEDYIYKIPAGINLLLILTLSLMASIVASRRGIYYSTIFTLLILSAFISMGFIFVMNGVLWDFFSIPVVVLAIYLTNGLTNYARLLLQSIKIKRFIITDTLTGLYTRRYFIFRLDGILKQIKEKEKLSLVLFSIDNLQAIVSEIGAEKANNLIREIGKLIARSSRKTRGMDFISRYGEVEFCSILHRTPEKGALAYANRIMHIISSRVSSVSSLTLSAGIADAGDLRDKSAKLFIKCAELAIAKARAKGPNTVCAYDVKTDKIPLMEYKEEKEISEPDLSYVAEELEEKYREMAILVNKLRTAQEEIIKSERLAAVGKVAATIHHDLSKPIVDLISSLEMVKQDVDKVNLPELATAKKFVSAALDETKRLEGLSESLKDLYIPKEKEIQPIFINSLLEDILSLSTGQIIDREIKSARMLSPGLPCVLADRGELKQVFLNLVHNAIESMSGGGELRVSTSIARDRENMVAVQISDTGYGIAPEHLNRIFEAFFTTKKKEKGAGLGLYASMEIVKKYGGTITVESALNKGSTFTVCLPFKPSK